MKKPDINFFDLQSHRTYRDLSLFPGQGKVIEGDAIIKAVAPLGLDAYMSDDNPHYSDLMKGSGVVGTRVETYLISGVGAEDAIDFNNECKNVVLTNGTMTAGVKNGITVKGGCEDMLFDTLLIRHNGRSPHTHIDLGNHSDQSFKVTQRIEFREVYTDDNRPVILRVGHAKQPVLVNTNVKRLVFEDGALKVYVYAKHFFPFIP